MNSLLRSILIVVLILAALPLPAQDEASETPAAAPAPYLASAPQELFAKGVALAERGAVAEAGTLFKALTLAYPELPEPHINLAVLLADEGKVEASADELEAAMQAHPLCRAVIDLEFQRQMGLYSAAVLGAPASPAASSPAVPVAAPSAPSPPAPPPSSPSPPPARPATEGEIRVVRQAADPCLNFRPEPTAAAAALECLPPGTPVRWLETAGDWSRVALRDGRVGWMGAAYLTIPDS